MGHRRQQRRSSTVGSHVIYESRLELARLLFADFDVSARQIVAQPFLLRASVDRKPRKHVPDYLLITDTGPVVVDVKPAHRLADPKVTFTFEWTRELVEARGWRYEVATEPIAVELENVRFLAGYRRNWLFRPGLLAHVREKNPGLLAHVREKNLDGSLLGDALKCLPGQPIHHVKSAVLHLLWRQELLIALLDFATVEFLGEIQHRCGLPESGKGIDFRRLLEHFFVVCPGVVEDKARPGFDAWWQEATTDDVLL